MSNFKVGDVVKTCDGREVEILKVDAPGGKPIIAMFLDNACTVHLYPNGRYYSDKSTSIYDLIPPKRTREVTVWCNLYSDRGTEFCETEQDARDIVRFNRAQDKLLAVAVPHTFTIEY